MTIPEIYDIFINKCNQSLSTDTRNIISGSLFFAWKGENHDGNLFAVKALKAGAHYAVVDNPDYVVSEHYILVDDSIQTLQDLARYHRMQFDIPVIAITGSNGKTTTKELIAEVLKTEKKIIATIGSLNNHVGVPRTLFDINKDTDIAIIEMGANHVGEINDLCNIAIPNFGIITNIGRAHIGEFGGFDNIIRGKTELYRYLEKANGTTFVNAADQLLLQKSNTNEKITYCSADSEYPIILENTSPLVSLTWNGMNIQSQLTGEYNIMNIAAAIAVGDYFGISADNIQKGIEGYAPQNNRSEIFKTKKGNTIIKDYYNANYNSMELALKNLSKIETTNPKIVIIGDMFELGEYEHTEHVAVAEYAQSLNFEKIILVGKAFSKIEIKSENIKIYLTTSDAISALQKLSLENSYILLKASNGMNFENVFNEINK